MKVLQKFFRRAVGSWYFKVGLLGLILRLILMPITAHPDIWSLSSASFLFTEKKVLNIYDYLASLPSTHPLLDIKFLTYPPLFYFTFGFFGLLLRFFCRPDIGLEVMENLSNIYSHPGVFNHLFFLKVPYLLFDLGTAYLLLKFFVKEKEKRLAYLCWLFNPLSLYSAYMVGQFELIPTFFVVLALYLAKVKKGKLAALSLGIGGAYKMFPLYFVPILAVSLGKKIREKTSLLILGFLPFLISIAPFISSPNFRALVLFSKQSQKFLYMSLPLSTVEGIFIFVLIWGIIFFLSYYHRKREELIWLWFLAILLAFFSVTHYHPQWFVWLTPLLVIQLVKTDFKFSFLTAVMLFSWLIITLLFESSLNYGLFIPLNPRLWDAPSLANLVAKYCDVFQLKSIIRSLFAAASLVMIFYSLKRKNEIS